jgi:hypothetical protein
VSSIDAAVAVGCGVSTTGTGVSVATCVGVDGGMRPGMASGMGVVNTVTAAATGAEVTSTTAEGASVSAVAAAVAVADAISTRWLTLTEMSKRPRASPIAAPASIVTQMGIRYMNSTGVLCQNLSSYWTTSLRRDTHHSTSQIQENPPNRSQSRRVRMSPTPW